MNNSIFEQIIQIGIRFFQEVYSLFFQMAPYLLLGFTVAGILSVTLKRSLVARHAGSPGLASVIKAALLGVPLPLCSCAVVPTAGYLRQAGASRPSLLAFLISTPQTGVDSIIATYGMMGPVFAVLRPVIALFTGIAGGVVSMFTSPRTALSETGSLDAHSPAAISAQTGEQTSAQTGTRPGGQAKEPSLPPNQEGAGNDSPGMLGSIRRAADYAYVESIDDIALHFLFGLAVAGLIGMLIPNGFLEGSVIASGLPGMLLMVVIGVPMYICSTSSIPVAVALIAAGISPGAAYVFLVAGPATNAATLAILKRMLGLGQTVVYLGTIIAGALIFGPFVNLVFSLGGWDPAIAAVVSGEEQGLAIPEYISGALLGMMIVLSVIRTVKRKIRSRKQLDHPVSEDHTSGSTENSITMNIEGMTCAHCAATVTSALERVAGAGAVKVDLAQGMAVITGAVEKDALDRAVETEGYSVKNK